MATYANSVTGVSFVWMFMLGDSGRIKQRELRPVIMFG
jgi:hypothetical protein